MANMGYCRFENTYKDLEECRDVLDENGFGYLSESERQYADLLYESARDYIRIFEMTAGIDDSNRRQVIKRCR